MEEVELNEEDIEYYTVCNITVDCPKCGHAHTEYDIEYEKEYVIECENCGYKYSFYHCPY